MSRPGWKMLLWCILLPAFFALVLLGWNAYRQSSVFLLDSASGLYLSTYAIPKQDAMAIPADSITIDREQCRRIKPLFENHLVVNISNADCSFIAAYMLMVQRDPDYPCRVLSQDADGYTIRLPGLEKQLRVRADQLRSHHESLRTYRPYLRRLGIGHLIPAVEILRCAYYEYQRTFGRRSVMRPIYTGGSPEEDLMMLSGVRNAYILEAQPGGNDPSSRRFACFRDHTMTLTEAFFDGQRYSYRLLWRNRIPGRSMFAGFDPSRYLTIVASSGKANPLFGQRIVPSHAYYLLDIRDNGDLVLGNPYQTHRPIVVSMEQFERRFSAVFFIEKQPRTVDGGK